MKLTRLLVFAAIAAFLPLAALAQTQVIFTNNDGTFTFDQNPTDSTYNELTLGTISNGLGAPGMLTAISGLTAFGVPDASVPFPCSPCLGTITLTTGVVDNGGKVWSENPAKYAQFAPGGSFKVKYADGVSFKGTFIAATWTSAGQGTNTWNFFGTIMDGVLTVNGSQYMIPTAATVQLTTVGQPADYHKNKNTYTFSDSGGSTNFSVAPEPGTLTLFGSGLIAVGMFTKRRIAARTAASRSSRG